MKYENDPLLPILNKEIQERSEAFKGLSAEEESKLLSLTADQKQVIAAADRAAKKEFLVAQPQISNAGVKAQQKFQSYVATLGH